MALWVDYEIHMEFEVNCWLFRGVQMNCWLQGGEDCDRF